VALGLDDGGREKATLIERLAGAGKEAAEAPKPEPTAKGNGASKGSATTTIDLAPGEKLTREKLEGYLWSAADNVYRYITGTPDLHRENPLPPASEVCDHGRTIWPMALLENVPCQHNSP
jgi:hypothetical protein